MNDIVEHRPALRKEEHPRDFIVPGEQAIDYPTLFAVIGVNWVC